MKVNGRLGSRHVHLAGVLVPLTGAAFLSCCILLAAYGAGDPMKTPDGTTMH